MNSATERFRVNSIHYRVYQTVKGGEKGAIKGTVAWDGFLAQTISYDVIRENLKKFFFFVFALLGLKLPFSEVSVYAESSFIFLDIKKIKIENCSIYVHIYPLKSIFWFYFD